MLLSLIFLRMVRFARYPIFFIMFFGRPKRISGSIHFCWEFNHLFYPFLYYFINFLLVFVFRAGSYCFLSSCQTEYCAGSVELAVTCQSRHRSQRAELAKRLYSVVAKRRYSVVPHWAPHNTRFLNSVKIWPVFRSFSEGMAVS